ALPKFAECAANEELSTALLDHLEETKIQIQRLENIFEILDIKAGGKTCKGMKGLIEEGQELLEKDSESSVLDAGIISACQRIEHYEIAAYGCARSYAELLGYTEVMELLQTSLNEESSADVKLSEIALSVVNPDAA